MNRKWHTPSACLAKPFYFVESLCPQSPLRAAPGEDAVITDQPDVELKEFRLDELEATLRMIASLSSKSLNWLPSLDCGGCGVAMRNLRAV